MKIEIPSFEKAKVLVIGDVMLDRYLHGDVHRISPEAPVPILLGQQVDVRPGGAANVALNVASLGGKVKLFGLVGKDEEANILKKQLVASGVECFLFQVSGIPTINKLRVISHNQQLIRLDIEESFKNCDTNEMARAFLSQLQDANMVILSDYGKGTLCKSKELISLANSFNIPVLVDPKSKDFSIYTGATVVTPNLSEFEAVVGPGISEDDIEEKGAMLLKKHNFGALLITRGSRGMSLIQRDIKPLHLSTCARQVYDVTGAGDTVIAAFGVALAAGKDMGEAALIANVAAGIVVKRLGAVAVSYAELCDVLHARLDCGTGILSETSLLQYVACARERGEKIVMTNGCFDLLHPGHVTYLEKAKALGHRLIVAVNDDKSVEQLKGLKRPINKLQDRMRVLAALRAVDWVVSFSESTPERLIKAIAPDFLVKGGDYKTHQIAGADFILRNKGEVVIIPFEEGFSASAIISRIKER